MDIQIDLESAIAVVDVGEASSVPEIESAIEALLAHPDYVDGMDSIFDYRRCDFSKLSAEDLKSIARFLAPHLPRFAKRISLVVERDLEYGLARMYGVYAEEIAPRERRIFRDIDAAREWFLSNKQP
ncbi:MAG: hypothetical protein IIA05_08565 [Proteobacteria bacterium]|nr:hypothetical protein [Pseudomonadota bacterium]